MTETSAPTAKPPLFSKTVNAILLVAALGIGGVYMYATRPAPARQVPSVGWSTDRIVVLRALKIAFPKRLAPTQEWSPMVTEGDKTYYAVWYDPADTDNVIRAYDGGDYVTSLSFTGTVDSKTQKDDVAAMLKVMAPLEDDQARAGAANAIDALIKSGPTSHIRLDGLDVRVSKGAVHYTVLGQVARG